MLRAAIVVLAAVSGLAATRLHAQGMGDELLVDSEGENYLRLLQVTGDVAAYPWSIRSFSPRELARLLPRDSLHPWAARYRRPLHGDGPGWIHWIPPEVRLTYNSAFPYGSNDGPVWAGRGLTTALQGGFAAGYGPISLVVAPVYFRAENQAFPLAGPPRDGPARFRTPWSTRIDLPQRFGDGPYARLDPGQSTLRIDALGVTAGVSIADQQWGPAIEYPLLLGNNAPGFRHAFLGTARPVDLWVMKLHGRAVWGKLDQSAYSPAPAGMERRFMSGLVLVASPRGLDGLELGAARFFHTPWPEGGLGFRNFRKPFEGILGKDVTNTRENQLASVFARWVFPASQLEIYGEYLRDDYNATLRDLIVEPDHISGYELGFRKVWSRPDRALLALRAELVNGRITHLERVRFQTPLYVHTPVVQGHTERGQILGSPAAFGGAGSTVAVDYYGSWGRWTLEWTRTLRQSPYGNWNPDPNAEVTPAPDVMHAVGGEAFFPLGRFDLTTRLMGVYELNRDFGSDEFNLNAVLGVRARM
ncbi:MAG TPA: capsule assembly Wzi family protein [Longimicrobiaceae bacterium]|nr:capsule assembly Wzi family protein [Longimicrobiaceae bacterium]